MLKAKYLWYFNGFLLIVLSIISYKIWFSPRKDAWDFIPENAFLVLESSEIQSSIFPKKNIRPNGLAEIPFFYDALAQLKKVAEVADNPKISEDFLHAKLITFSLHRENKKNLEYIIYIPADNIGDDSFIKALQVPNPAKRKIYARNYKGLKMNELYSISSELLFNFFITDNFLVCSSSKVLLEEAANNVMSGGVKDKSPFKESRKGEAHIYFKSKNLEAVADILPSQLSPNLISFFGSIMPRNPDIIFEKQQESSKISAYIHSKGTNQIPFLGIFGKQKPQAFQALSLIPENTAITFRMSFRNKLRMGGDFANYIKQHEVALHEEKIQVNQLLNYNLNSLYSLLKDEVILCEMETVTNEPSGKILLINTEDSAEALNLLEDLANTAEKTTYFKQKPFTYLNYYVRKLEISQLPALLFGSIFRGFAQCYYTQKDNYIILASEEEAMKGYLNQITNGQTWANSTYYRDFAKKLSASSQMTAIISPQRIWNNIYYSLPQKWQSTTLKHEARIKNLRFIAIENFVLNEQFGTKLLIEKVPSSAKSGKLTNQLFLQDSLSLSASLQGSVALIKNPQTAQDEIIVQTSDGKLMLVSNQAKLINEIPTSILFNLDYLLPTDYFQNGLLQYLTKDQNKVLIIGRDYQKGLTLHESSFPFDSNIVGLSSSETKIYATDSQGNIYFLDKELQKISRIKSAINLSNIIQIESFKFKNNNYLAVLQKDGSLNVLYETGAQLSGFPKVPLNGRPLGMIIEEKGDKLVAITLVSDLGEIKKIILGGEQDQSYQIERLDKSTTFQLLFDQEHKDWLIIRRTPSSLVIFDSEGKAKLKIEKTDFFKSKIKYFNLGKDLRAIVVFDGKNNTIFDWKGNILGQKPIAGSSIATLSFSESFNKIFVYNPNKKTFEIWTIKLK